MVAEDRMCQDSGEEGLQTLLTLSNKLTICLSEECLGRQSQRDTRTLREREREGRSEKEREGERRMGGRERS